MAAEQAMQMEMEQVVTQFASSAISSPLAAIPGAKSEEKGKIKLRSHHGFR
jgi:hypothetical protein